jgi:hypothetical protein
MMAFGVAKRWHRGSALLWLAAVLAAVPVVASAQVPACDGDDPPTAHAEHEAGASLIQDAIADIRAGGGRAREFARRALAHFDRQCAAGDDDALSERGAAWMLIGDPLRSAQSYDAFLRHHVPDTLDPQLRRRVEQNLQPGLVDVAVSGGEARLYVDDLDFGPLPRTLVLHLPTGPHRFEARDDTGAVRATTEVTLGEETTPTHVALALSAAVARAPRTDYLPWYAAAGFGVVGFVATGIGLLAIAGGRQHAYELDMVCIDPSMAIGCEAVIAERDAATAFGVASFVLAGLSAAMLATVAVIDLGQPAQRAHVAVVPHPGGAALVVDGAF